MTTKQDQPRGNTRIVERRTSPRTGDAIWMKFECGAGSRWISTTENWDGCVCNYSGCNCGTIVRKVGETDNRYENWFGLRVGKIKPVDSGFDVVMDESDEIRRLREDRDRLLAACKRFVEYAENGKHPEWATYLRSVAGERMRQAIAGR